MGKRDWAAEARKRWPHCDVVVGGAWWLHVSTPYGFFSSRSDSGEWVTGSMNGGIPHEHKPLPIEVGPIAAIEAAIRAEQDEARATLARLAVWNVDQSEAVSAAGVVLL